MEEQSLTLFLLVFTFWPIIVFWGSAEALYYHAHLAPQIERDLGFQGGTGYIDGPFTGEKYLVLCRIQTSGRMDLAGFRLSDIVLNVDKVGFTGFWQRLEEARGSAPVPITVASWSDPGLVANRPTRQLIVSVPRKNFSTALEAALGFRCDVEYFKENGSWVGVVVVRNLVPDGLMAKVGFQDRDILLDVGGVPDLFERLEQARGPKQITLEVVPWLDPTDIADRPVRELMLEIPAAENRPDNVKYRLDSLRGFEHDLGFRQGWERLPHQGKWHGWPIVEKTAIGKPFGSRRFSGEGHPFGGILLVQTLAQGSRQRSDHGPGGGVDGTDAFA